IDALKGKCVKGYAWIPVRNIQHRLESPNEARALGWFAIKAYDFISAKKGLKTPFFFVPIPDSGCVVNTKTVPRMFAVATDLATRFGNGSEALDILRWKKPMVPTHQGGTRDVELLYKNLKVVGEL